MKTFQHRIIFEGFDNTGKSTIAAALSKRLGIPLFKNDLHDTLFAGGDVTYYHNLKVASPSLVQFMQQTWGPLDGVIMDRFIPSEYAYAMAYNRQTDYDLIWELDSKLADLDFMTILCVKKDIPNFEDEFVDAEMNNTVTNFYLDYLAESRMKSLILDTSDQDIEKQFSIISHWLRVGGRHVQK